MSALHVKTFDVYNDGGSLYADLQVAKEGPETVLRVRITRAKKKGSGFARVNHAGELFRADEELNLTEKEREAIEGAIKWSLA